MSNNVKCATSKASDQPGHMRSLSRAFASRLNILEYAMSVKLPNEHHLKFLSLKGSCKGLSESTFVKIPHCWKSHITAHLNKKTMQMTKRLQNYTAWKESRLVIVSPNINFLV